MRRADRDRTARSAIAIHGPGRELAASAGMREVAPRAPAATAVVDPAGEYLWDVLLVNQDAADPRGQEDAQI